MIWGRIEMVESNKYASKFANRYGEEWEFEYEPSTGEGRVRGSDVDWEEYRVIGGQAIGLNMNNEEILWLRTAWAEALAAHNREPGKGDETHE